MKISIIGLRAYPSEFVGTSGLEVYGEKVAHEILKKNKDIEFCFYTKKKYQRKPLDSSTEKVNVIPVNTLNSKVLESVFYSFIASVLACYDRSSVVWYHGVGPGIFSIIPKIFGKRVILTIHSLDWQRKKWNTVEKYLFKLFSSVSFFGNYKIFTVSNYLVARLKKEFRVSAILAHPGIEIVKTKPSVRLLEKFGIKEGRYLLYLGRIVPEKRVEWLLDEYLRLKDKFKNLKVVIAGGHGNIPNYEKKLKEKYQDPGIIWLGYIFGKDKKSLLYYSRAFILPSELEGNSISFMEALGFGCRCVISDDLTRGFKYLKNIYSFGNSQRSFAISLGKSLAAPSKFYAYTDQIRLKLLKLNWEKTAAIYLTQIAK